jgi:prefoldin beta subunit
LGLAGADSNIYKLVGPILVKQEKQEAMTQVKNRIEFINGEMYA